MCIYSSQKFVTSHSVVTKHFRRCRTLRPNMASKFSCMKTFLYVCIGLLNVLLTEGNSGDVSRIGATAASRRMLTTPSWKSAISCDCTSHVQHLGAAGESSSGTAFCLFPTPVAYGSTNFAMERQRGRYVYQQSLRGLAHAIQQRRR